MIALVGAVAWALGASMAWAFFAGAARIRHAHQDLRRRRDRVLAGDPDIGMLDDGHWDIDCSER